MVAQVRLGAEAQRTGSTWHGIRNAQTGKCADVMMRGSVQPWSRRNFEVRWSLGTDAERCAERETSKS